MTTTIDYAYDPLYRLTSADNSTGPFFHYTYDSVGNRLTQATQAGTNNYGYDAADQRTRSARSLTAGTRTATC